MRNLCAAFLFTSAFAYLAGAWLVILGTPPILNISGTYQIIVFFIMAMLTFAASQVNGSMMDTFRGFLAVVWGGLAAFTFVGYVVWAPAGDPASRIFMTIWDLALAVCVLDEGE